MRIQNRLRLGYATLRARLAGRHRDRGDSPIPSTIIIAGLAVIAITLLAWLGTYVAGFVGEAPTSLPDPPELG